MKMNLDSFNNVLVNVGGIDREQLLIMEIIHALFLKIKAMEKLVKVLNAGDDYGDALKTVNNIDLNLDCMNERLEELEKEEVKNED